MRPAREARRARGVIASTRGRQEQREPTESSGCRTARAEGFEAVEGPTSLPRGSAAASVHGAHIVTDAGLSTRCSRDRRMRSQGWSAAVVRVCTWASHCTAHARCHVLYSRPQDLQDPGRGQSESEPEMCNARASPSPPGRLLPESVGASPLGDGDGADWKCQAEATLSGNTFTGLANHEQLASAVAIG